jgi:hypothetical protein
MNTLARLAVLGLIAAAWPAIADDATKGNPGSIWDQPLDHPGCSFIEGINGNAPGRTCRQNCCAVHDKCYDEHRCTSPSWLPTIANFLAGGGGPWLGYSGGATVEMVLTPAAQQELAKTPPGAGNGTLECQACNLQVAGCWMQSTVGSPCPDLCPPGQEACYDRSCQSGRNYYCTDNCYNEYKDVCEQEYGDTQCSKAQEIGYGVGATRFGMHGGALMTCVAFCYNVAAASRLLTSPALTLCAGNDSYEEDNPKAAAGGWISSIAGGSLCCYCGGATGVLPWQDPRWTGGAYNPPKGHSGKEGEHGAKAGCPSGCPCPQGAPCYNINGCWNDSHMCAQATCGQAIGMCCG